MEPGITWYEVLGVLPGADAEKIRRTYEERTTLLRGEMISGAPSNVLIVIRRAQEFLDGAWEVLGNPAVRERYDVAAGFRRRGGSLGESRLTPPFSSRRTRCRSTAWSSTSRRGRPASSGGMRR
jgi:curved DNA-binding protein CbpA